MWSSTHFKNGICLNSVFLWCKILYFQYMSRVDIIYWAELHKVLILLRFVGGGSTVVRNILRASLADAACVRACIYTSSSSKAAWSGSVHTSNTWVGRAVSASTAVQSTPSKATTGWTCQPMTCAARVTATNGMRWKAGHVDSRTCCRS